MPRKRCQIKFFAVILLLANVGCDPEPPRVNSPGAGNRWVFTKVSGDNQSTPLHDTLAQRMVVQLKKLNGIAIDNENIRFLVISGGGEVRKPAGAHDLMELVTPTDFEGKATAQFFNFGGDSVTGLSQVRAEVLDSSNLFVLFTIDTN